MRNPLHLYLAGILALLLIGIGIESAYPNDTRDPSQVRLFRKANPCPATGSTTGACPGYVVDHTYPLCAGGLDIPANMIWQDTKASYIKDRIERELCACKKGK